MIGTASLIDLSGRWSDPQHQTAEHETGHALLAEKFGIAIKRLSVRPDGDAAGYVEPDGLWPESRAMLAVYAAGYQAQHASIRGGNAEGAANDHKRARQLALRLSGGCENGAADMLAEARGTAASIIADRDHEFIHSQVKRTLLERGSLTALEFGEVIAHAKLNMKGGRYLTSRRLTDLTGDEGPCERAWKRTQAARDLSEELDRREATLREIGASRPAKRRATTKPATKGRAPKRVPPGFNSPDGFIASENFGALIGDRRTIVHAGSWYPNGHPIVCKYVTKFRAAPSRRKAPRVPCPEFA